MPDTSGSHGDAAALAPLVLHALASPGLVVVAGPAGSGRSTTLRRVIDAYDGRTFTGTGFAALREVPGCVLFQAVRRSLPTHDLALLAEAVRACVGDGLLVLDDVHWADAATLASLPAIAAHCRVVVATRTDHPRAESIEPSLRAAARDWFTVTPPLAGPAVARPEARTRRAGPPGADGPGGTGSARPAGSAGAARPGRRVAGGRRNGRGDGVRVGARVAVGRRDGRQPSPPEERRALHLRLAELMHSDGAPTGLAASDSASVAALERARHLAAGGEPQLALDAARAAAVVRPRHRRCAPPRWCSAVMWRAVRCQRPTGWTRRRPPSRRDGHGRPFGCSTPASSGRRT